MNAVQLVSALIAALGGLGGGAAYLRSRAQNRLDAAATRKTDAEADGLVVQTARELIADVRNEMDRKVADLAERVAYFRGQLDTVQAERDEWRDRALRAERTVEQLQGRVGRLEARVRALTPAT